MGPGLKGYHNCRIVLDMFRVGSRDDEGRGGGVDAPCMFGKPSTPFE